MANISDLQFDDKNFNKHTAHGMGLLEKSLQKLGAGRSILIDRDGKIIAGNGIVEAAGNIGLEDVQIVESDGSKIIAVKRTDITLDSEQGREMALADNATAAADLSWDNDTIAEVSANFGFDPGDWISDWNNDADVEVEEDEAPEVDESEPAKSELGKVYQLGNHRLMCGDSTDARSVAILMDGQKADMVFTDPPYLMGFTGNVHADGSKSFNSKHGAILNDKMSREDGDVFVKKIFDVMGQFTKGAFYVCFYRLGLDYIFRALDAKKLDYKALIIWDKGNHTLSNSDYMSKYEPIVYGWFEEHSFYGGRSKFDIWSITRTQKNDLHPTMKPIALCATAIQNSSKKGEGVLDLFGGSGSTLIACEQLGRKCYMMELDPKYCDVIRKRYWKLTHDGNEEGWEEGTPAV